MNRLLWFCFLVQSVFATHTYLGPIRPIPGNPDLVQVEVLVRDSPEAGGVEIASVEFNKKNIPLQPADIYGNRGTASFQVAPGTYTLRWKVNLHRNVWPRNVTHEEIVTINPRDSWLQISVTGEEATID